MKTSRKYDEETVQVINTKSKTQVRKDKRQQKKADVEAQTKEALYAFHQQTGQGFTFPNKGYGGARNNQNKNGYGGNTSYNKNGNSSFNKMAMDGLEDDLKRIILTLIKKGEIGITATTRI